jgi:hypothetical protein
MNIRLLLTAFIIATLSSCDKTAGQIDDYVSTSFMPLQIGNYWRMNAQNFSEVQDTVRIKGKLYYKIFSLTGGDVSGEQYFRIDEDQNLISSSPRYPDYKYTRAKFNANVGDTFQTLGDQSYNDYKVTVVEKSDTKMTFSYDMIYHPNLKGHPHTETFIKGTGWDDQWKSMRINGIVYSR